MKGTATAVRCCPVAYVRPFLWCDGAPMKPVISSFRDLAIERRKVQPFDVLAFDKDGQTRVFAGYGK